MKEATKREALARRTASNQNGKKQSKSRRRVGDAEVMVYAKEYELEINDRGATKEECAPWRVTISDLELLRLLSLLDRLLLEIDPSCAKHSNASAKDIAKARSIIARCRQCLEACSDRPETGSGGEIPRPSMVKEKGLGLAKVAQRRAAIADVFLKLPVVSVHMQHSIWRALPHPQHRPPSDDTQPEQKDSSDANMLAFTAMEQAAAAAEEEARKEREELERKRREEEEAARKVEFVEPDPQPATAPEQIVATKVSAFLSVKKLSTA
eukprot:SAG31_NODE_1421_length_8423_cov_2.477054_6_plen_267_part_00